MPTPPPNGQKPDFPVPANDSEEVIELLALAETVIKGNLCSRHFPSFVAGIQRDIGHEPPAVVRKFALMFSTSEGRGSHYTAWEVAKILRGCAGRLQRGEPMPKGF